MAQIPVISLKEAEMRSTAGSNGILLLGAFCLTAPQVVIAQSGNAVKPQIRRGEYLANYGGCSDCHTPKIMTPNGPVLDRARLLSGHPANTQLPPIPTGALGPTQWGAITTGDLTAWVGPWGTSFAANLTPDNVTGSGGWTSDQFIKTMRSGKHLGVGRELLPPMPWFDIGLLTDKDLKALFAYLKSLKPMVNQVPEPVAQK
jgi:mono/diheme cytochrome c family protein